MPLLTLTEYRKYGSVKRENRYRHKQKSLTTSEAN